MNLQTSSNPNQIPYSKHASSLIRVGLPLALSQLSEMAMGVTDTILLGGLSVSAVAIGGIANNFFFSTMVIFQSLLGGVGVMLAHSRGAQDHGHEISHDGRSVMSAGFILSLFAFVPCLLILLCSSWLFSIIDEPTEVMTNSTHFINILLYSLFPQIAIVGLFRVALPSLGAESLLLWIMPAMALCNGIMNAALIHGWFGFPAYGLFGSAHATSLTGWAIALAMVFLCWRRPEVRYVMHPVAVKLSVFKELLRLGIPMMAATAAELLMFQITTLRAGTLGTQSLAAHQVALNTASLLFMVSLAIGQAVNVRVAYWRGAGKMPQSRRSAVTAMGLVFIWTALSGAVLIFFPQYIVDLFFSGAPASPETVTMTITLLKIAGIFQMVDGFQTVFGGALRGCGDVYGPMLITVCSYGVVGIGLGEWLAFHHHDGVAGLWIGLAVGLGVAALALGARTYRIMHRPI
ncbi:MATE family efflux transporter [Aristophania vespae]|uniref:Multidrug-efflux transporter n=1 Tax=Aristophania vespae TaxID=2697033 RepID=A0A6P1NCU8_9PROT|nr:MATE family efflux transporter [Aristophania vespae]QHI95313.1 MATE family efflux transporter [Aristophania vespae]